MSTKTPQIPISFDALPDTAKHELALEILRGARKFDFPLLTDEELTANAEALFHELDEREMNYERSE